MQLFKFHSGGILSHSWKGSHGPTCGVLHRSGIFHHQCLNQGTQKRNSWPPTAKRDPELGELPKSRPQAPRLQVFQGAELRFVFVSWTIFCICRGDTATHPCLPQQKVEKLWPTPGTFNPVALGDNMQFFSAEFSLSQVMLLMNRNFRSSQIWHLKQMQSCQVRFRLLYQLQCILRVCQLGGSSPPPLLCGRCLLF